MTPIILALLLTVGNADAPRSNLASDERLVFFPTAASLDAAGEKWHVPIHGWVHELETTVIRKGMLADFLDKTYGLKVDKENAARFDRRVRLLLADNERGKRIVIDVAGKRIELPESAANGHFQSTVELSRAEAETHAKEGWIPFHAILKTDDKRLFSGRARLVKHEGLTVVSDLDDTIKISHVTRTKDLLASTFFEKFRAVPHMARLFDEWQEFGAVFHYVSSSPAQLYEPLAELLQQSGFPAGSFHLRAVRFRDQSVARLFESGAEAKRSKIRRLLQNWPRRSFILVGDGGEEDPEIYGELAREFPAQVARILIRDVRAEGPHTARFYRAFAEIPGKRWIVFTNPRTLIAKEEPKKPTEKPGE